MTPIEIASPVRSRARSRKAPAAPVATPEATPEATPLPDADLRSAAFRHSWAVLTGGVDASHLPAKDRVAYKLNARRNAMRIVILAYPAIQRFGRGFRVSATNRLGDRTTTTLDTAADILLGVIPASAETLRIGSLA
jgi:hypothetical protein